MSRNEMMVVAGLVSGAVFVMLSILGPGEVPVVTPLLSGSVFTGIGIIVCGATLKELEWSSGSVYSGCMVFGLSMFSPFLLWAAAPATVEVVMLCLGG